MKDSNEELGVCPLCERIMFKGSSDRHHLIPVSRGGKETVFLHKICHQKIHHTLTEKQLEKEFNTAEALLKNEEIIKFVKWVKKKDPRYYDKNSDTKERSKKR